MLSKKLTMAIWLLGALALLAFACALEGGLYKFSSAATLNGFTPRPMLLFDLFLVMTALFFVAALVVPHNYLAVGQGVGIAVYGLAMIFGGFFLALAALAKLIGLITLLFAFPFGTIAYFVKYHCSDATLGAPLSLLAGGFGGACFDGSAAVLVVAGVVKAAGFLVLCIASVRFLKVKGLVVLGALSFAIALALTWALIEISSLSFLLYPADAALTIVVAIIAVIYGLVTFLKGLFALALAIAGLVA